MGFSNTWEHNLHIVSHRSTIDFRKRIRFTGLRFLHEQYLIILGTHSFPPSLPVCVRDHLILYNLLLVRRSDFSACRVAALRQSEAGCGSTYGEFLCRRTYATTAISSHGAST